VYQVCLAKELALQGIKFESQKPLVVEYEGERLEAGYKLDFVVEGKVVIEIKAVDELHPVHEAQLLTYLRLTTAVLGF
jgi:GxxExxY protein